MRIYVFILKASLTTSMPLIMIVPSVGLITPVIALIVVKFCTQIKDMSFFSKVIITEFADGHNR